jgi:hypothetical protein
MKRVLAVAAVLACTTTACGGGTGTASAPPSRPSATSTQAGPSPATHPAASPSQPLSARLSRSAVKQFGQARLQAASKELLAFTFQWGWKPDLIVRHVDGVTKADFAALRGYLTPAYAKTFDTEFAKVAKHDKAATRQLEGAVFFGIRGPQGIGVVHAGKVVTDRTYSQVLVGLEKTAGVPQLSVAFTAKANIHMQDAAGKPYVLPTSRKVRYVLVPNKGRDSATKPFIIAHWLYDMSASKLVASP